MASYFRRIFRPVIREYLMFIPEKKSISGLFKLILELLKPGALIYPDIVCVLTTHCSLRCAHCNNLMQCYDKPYHVPAEEVIEDLETLLSHSDRCMHLTLLGGEPFIYPDLYKVVEAFRNHPKIGCLNLVTNATVIPDDSLLDLIAGAKNPRISVSDYGVRTQKVPEFLEKCRKKGIHCIHDESKNWVDPGGTSPRGKDIPTLEKEYNGCFSARYCRTLLKGKLYTCARAASLADLGFMDGAHDSFDIRKPRTDAEFRKELREFLTIDYADACNYCDHARRIIIPAGEQLES